ncbi:hypothetical protein CEXT_541581 [Caerostris extrusa]|uniref:Uncharacterized protein n=1 Tax=Caerostris extrusa TaxID=172846 RepID=A0AAV4UN63_CAEEX|nr:hypothetical protein CEXT_541581 [Caerostris extrusa]
MDFYSDFVASITKICDCAKQSSFKHFTLFLVAKRNMLESNENLPYPNGSITPTIPRQLSAPQQGDTIQIEVANSMWVLSRSGNAVIRAELSALPG